MRTVLATLDLAKGRLVVPQQVRVVQQEASCAMDVPEPTSVGSKSMTFAYRRPSQIPVAGTMTLRGLPSMTSFELAVVPRPRSPPNS